MFSWQLWPFYAFKIHFTKCLWVSQSAYLLSPPSSALLLSVWRSVKHLTLITASHWVSTLRVAWAKLSSVLPQLITALHHHLCPSLSSLCLCSYPVSSLSMSAALLPAVFMEPSRLRVREQDDLNHKQIYVMRHCETVKEKLNEWEPFALSFLVKYATR